MNPYALRTLRERLRDITLIVDAGLGAPSHAAQALGAGLRWRTTEYRHRASE